MVLNQSAHSLRIELPAIVRAKCKKINGEEVDASLDLNPLVGNNNGHFDAPGENFVASATKIHLKGFILHADLKKVDGHYRHDTLNLDRCLSNEDGHLKFHLGQFISAKQNYTVGSSAVSQICDTCRGFPISIDACQPPLDAVFFASLGSLEAQKVRSNCPVCDLLTRIARDLSKEDPWYANPNTICSGGRTRDGPTWVNFEFKEDRQSEAPAKHRRFVLYQQDNNPIETETFIDVRRERHIVADPTSDQTVSHVRNWIDECSRKHSKCKVSNDEHVLPFRILDLGNGTSDTIHLMVTDGKKGVYACLSYCWGNAVGANLTQDNLDEFQKGVKISSLPQTYRDVIAFCRRLSIRYLWIDALCILQKNVVDWRQESVKMHEYYGGSYICIAATSSGNLDAGCNARLSPMQLKGRGRDNKPYTLFLRPEIHHIAHGNVDHESNNFPLLRRAWCYQERRLAPRVLHFSGNELFFECAEMSACECGEPGDRFKSGSWTKDKELFYIQHLDISSAKNERERVQHEWFAHVRAFSGLNITRNTDRLPAISGLAKRCQQSRDQLGIPSGRYLAGIWEEQLIDGLSWCVGKEVSKYVKEGNLTIIGSPVAPREAQIPRPKEYLAPSWSWASVLDPVQYNIPFSKPLCTVVNAETSLLSKDSDLLGQVSSGSITLRSKLRKCHGEWVTTGFLPGYWGLVNFPGTKFRKCMKWLPDYKIQDLEGSLIDLFLMPLTSRPRGRNHRIVASLLNMGDLTVYLVLRSNSADTYERIGWAYTEGEAIDMKGQKEVDIKII